MPQESGWYFIEDWGDYYYIDWNYRDPDSPNWKVILILVGTGILILALLFASTDVSPQTEKPLPVDLSSHSLVGGPSISASFINTVLSNNGSPAAGTGQDMYTLGVEYGIDPVYALAFFKEESSFGTTGVAQVTHSIGNSRCSAGYSCYLGYRAYGSWQEGYQDWYQLIKNLYIGQWGKSTVEEIIPTYAPPSENDTQSYIDNINTWVATWRQENQNS